MAFDAIDDAMTRGSDSDSTTIWIKLQAGDKVWTSAAVGDEYTLYGVYHTMFSGALLYAL